MKSTLITLSALVALGATKTIDITVGPGLVFDPDNVTGAQSGDILAFKFANTEHDVVQGDLDNACQPSGDNAVYSGMPQASGDVFSVTVNSTDALYFYCSVPGHCQGGMVMAMNAPDGDLAKYQKEAASASGSSEPANVQGGTYGSASSASSSSAASSSGSMSTAMSSASGASMSASSASMSASSASMSASSSSTSNVAGATGVSFAGAAAAAGLAAFLL